MANILDIGAASVVALTLIYAVATAGPKVGPPSPVYLTPAYSQAVNKAVAAYAAETGPTAPKAASEGAGIRLRSVGFEFPIAGRSFPPGPGADQISANCVTCHTPGMILNQPALTRAEWTTEVNKMVKVYKAPVDDADIPEIITYLANLNVAR